MNSINPIIILFPMIALILVVILYFHLLNKTLDRKAFQKFIFTTFVLAFLLNFFWEVVQMPFYKATFFPAGHIAFCALASIADAIMVLLLYLGLGFIFRNPFWIQDVKWQRVVILIFTGATGAILSELRHLSLGTWAYANSMLIIPMVNVGITPVLQFMILPLLVYILSFHGTIILNRKDKNYSGHI